VLPFTAGLAAIVAIVVAGVGQRSFAGSGPAGAACGGPPRRVMSRAATLSGSSIAAVDRNAIAYLTPSGVAGAAAPDGMGGIVRNATARAGIGTAYVRDRAGSDVVIAATAAGLRRFPVEGEATHPNWSSRGDLVWAAGPDLEVVAPGASRARIVAGPVRAGLVFSPLFQTARRIVAAVVAPPTRAVPEDEYLSNLWRFDTADHRWTQLTHFTAGVDRWSVVRTPMLRPDGEIEFVRITGRASLDVAPRFQLWRLAPGGARLVRPLPGEMYLAGYEGAVRVWNLRAGDSGEWRLAVETAGRLRDVGCGAVAVDPLDRVDPDLRPGHRYASLDPPAALGSAAATPGIATDAIIVGDFPTAAAAAEAATKIADATGSVATVTDADHEPALVRPGVSAVLVPVSAGTDPESALTAFRSALPEFAGWSWLVSV
jgi:hypothetical protein